jgi:hypothetical protein
MCRPLVRLTPVRHLTSIHTRSSERTSVEIDNQDPIFHVLYHLGERDTG